MDAFGGLRVWGVKLGNVFDINVYYHALYKTGFQQEGKIRAGKGDLLIDGVIYQTLAHRVDAGSDDPHTQLFFQAKDKLGELGLNHIYGLVPAAPLGGRMQLENLQIVDAPEYLAMLPELAPVREMTMQDLARMAFGSAAAQSLDKLLKEQAVGPCYCGHCSR